ncbi:unnamed protein product [Dicrocoelium dendriticum]|nr:unnamed protein product [Dicrocoelium dendriticum]
MAGGHSGSVGGGGGGGSSGGGSGRAQFRSQAGCCICGTKSSSSRFTVSVRYSEHFAGCFGQPAASRSGDLCNACVLCVKRWLQRNKPPGLFVQVLDSKKGPGPKHMKEITKRARRREAKNATGSLKSNAPSFSGTSATTSAATNASHRISSGSVSGPSFATRSTGGSVVSTLYASAVHQNQSNLHHLGRNCGSHPSESGASNPPATGPLAHGNLTSSQLEEFTRCDYRSSFTPYSLPPSKSSVLGGGRHPVICGRLQETFCSPFPVGATFTRAAAAAIRKSEASVPQPVAKVLSCSTPSRCSTEYPSIDVPTKPVSSAASETSEYGSGVFGQSSGCSSRCTTLDDATTGSGCSESSCGCASSGYSGLGCSPCCAFCSWEMTSCKQVKRDNMCDVERHCLCRGCLCTGHQSICHAGRSVHSVSPSSGGSSCCCAASATTTRSHSSCCLSEFRYPPPPPDNNNNNNSHSNNVSSRKRSACNEDTTISTSTAQTPTAPSTRRYNRRVVLPPVRMTHNAEVNSLLREIMERNSQAISFDSREMHMAVQKELRLRSRTVQGNSNSGSASGRTSSISSIDGASGSNPTASDSRFLSGHCTPNKHVCGLLATRHRVHCCCARLHHNHCCHMSCGGCSASEDGNVSRCG